MWNWLNQKLDRPYKWVLFGTGVTLLMALIGLPTFGDFFTDFNSRITGEGFINFEEIKAFCGWVAQEPGESEWAWRLRSASRAFSTQMAMMVLQIISFVGFFGLIYGIFHFTGKKKQNQN